MVEIILRAGADCDFVDGEAGETALMVAARTGQHKIAQTLLNAGADWEISNAIGYTALLVAAHHGHRAVIDVLANSGVDVRERHFNHFTALHVAALSSRVSAVERLIELGAPLDATTTREGATPLKFAQDAVRDVALSYKMSPSPRGSRSRANRDDLAKKTKVVEILTRAHYKALASRVYAHPLFRAALWAVAGFVVLTVLAECVVRVVR